MNISEVRGFLEKLKFDSNGLIPAIIREKASGEVLMMAYMNKESFEKTIETGYTWYFSRSRKELWNKGATSGNTQKVLDISYDCDGDCLLVQVEQTGPACHTGHKSCFYNHFVTSDQDPNTDELGTILEAVYKVILDRQEIRPEKSYTTYLFNEGQDKILKKIGEEAAEIIIASKNSNNKEVIYECGDFIYHMLVLLAYHGVTIDELAAELNKRR